MQKRVPTRSQITGKLNIKAFRDTEAVISKQAGAGTIKSRVAYKKKVVARKNLLENKQKELNRRYTFSKKKFHATY